MRLTELVLSLLTSCDRLGLAKHVLTAVYIFVRMNNNNNTMIPDLFFFNHHFHFPA